ncbi:MAG: PTS transporter subunit EIIC, partial [Firmicutes bacterium]|nr:PTS transporter subunit EIIC [Bacillota bacterium]
MATDKGKIASDVIAAVKGKDNIVSLGHCATRLRFVLRDYEKVNINDVKKVYGVITAVEKGGQLQVVIGNTVQEVYHEAIAILGDDLAGKTTEVTKFDWGSGEDWLKMIKSLPNRFFRMIGGIFPRVIMLMAACGIILGLMNLLMVTNVIKDGDDTYQLLNIIGGAALGSLPILLGFSAGRYFGSSGYLTAVIGIILTSPSWTPGQDFSIIGIHFTQFNYAGSVIPILFASFFCCILEKFLMKYLPSAIKQFVTPMICLLLIAPITLLIIGPIFNQVAEWLFQAWGTIDKPELAWIGGLITGALWQVLVIFGVHRTFDVIDTTNLSKTGSTSFVTYHQVAALSQTGAAFGVWLKMRDKAQKRMVLSTVITGVFGVTEPIIYGVTLPRKRPFVMGVIGG